jgi:hypothetical protein
VEERKAPGDQPDKRKASGDESCLEREKSYAALYTSLTAIATGATTIVM